MPPNPIFKKFDAVLGKTTPTGVLPVSSRANEIRAMAKTAKNPDTLGSRISTDIQNRGAAAQGAIAGTAPESIGEPSIVRGLQAAKEGAGAVMDVGNEIFKGLKGFIDKSQEEALAEQRKTNPNAQTPTLDLPIPSAVKNYVSNVKGGLGMANEELGTILNDWAIKHPEAGKALVSSLKGVGATGDIAGTVAAADVAGLGANKLPGLGKDITEIPGAVKNIATGTKDLISNATSPIINAVTPDSVAIMQRISRTTPTAMNKFAKIAGETQGQYLVNRGIFGSEENVMKKLYDRFNTSINAADTALASLPGVYKPASLKPALADLLARENRIGVVSSETAKINELANKYNSNGLTMSEINDVKRIYERTVKMDFLKTQNPEGVVRANRLDSDIRGWQFKKADDLGFKNLPELNKETQYAKQLLNDMGKKNIGSSGNNGLSLTDYILLAHGDVTAIAAYIAKKSLTSNTFLSRIAELFASKGEFGTPEAMFGGKSGVPAKIPGVDYGTTIEMGGTKPPTTYEPQSPQINRTSSLPDQLQLPPGTSKSTGVPNILPQSARETNLGLDEVRGINLGTTRKPLFQEELLQKDPKISLPPSIHESVNNVKSPPKAEGGILETSNRTDIAKQAADLTKKNGGVTINLDGDIPTEGFAYSPYKNVETVIPEAEFTDKDIGDFLNKNMGKLQTEGNHLGVWIDDGKVYIDISKVNPDESLAASDAMANKQIALFDLKTFETKNIKDYEKIGDTYSYKGQNQETNLGGSEGTTPQEGSSKSLIDKLKNTPNKQGGFISTGFKNEGNLTTKILKDLEGRDTVSRQYIQDATNRGELKQAERDITRQVLSTMKGDTINVKEFADKVKAELLPLKMLSRESSGSGGTRNIGRYEHITLPDEIKGNVENYGEHIYESPIKTSAGSTHFQDSVSGKTPENYFGHTRIEDMADNKTRRVIEVQSDLYQKGNLERSTGTAGTFENTSTAQKVKVQRESDLVKLQQYNDPTAHFRMIREEIKQAAVDGKSKLQFPTGETAMKIEGIGQGSESARFFRPGSGDALTPENIRVGGEVTQGIHSTDKWIITDVLGDGKFKAVPRNVADAEKAWKTVKDTYTPPSNQQYLATNSQTGEVVQFPTSKAADNYIEQQTARARDSYAESFDISGKVDTKNPIYKFYEKDVQNYLKKFGGKPVTDSKGVNWVEVPIQKAWAKQPVDAFGKAMLSPLFLGAGAFAAAAVGSRLLKKK